MATEPTIDYAKLQQDAMRGVIRAVLLQIVETGLPGEHHFYISFLTQAKGVILSKRLKEKYPQEMTIVLQHRFWDLIISEDRFEVKLTFDGIPERLVIPFSAVKVFFDPSVRYGLQFDDESNAEDTTVTADSAYDRVSEVRAESPRTGQPKKPRAPRKPRADKEPAERPAASAMPALRPARLDPPQPEPATVAAAAAARANAAEDEDTPESAERPDTGAKVVSLDQFRKK